MKPEDIRPKELFQRYLDLSKRDGDSLDRSRFVSVKCPGCGGDTLESRFEKNQFRLVACANCNSLFCNPRPAEDQLMEFYSHSESSAYWSDVFFPAVAEVRREVLFKKKALRLTDMLRELGINPPNICDVGAGYGIFLEEFGKLNPNVKLFAVEPDSKLAAKCTARGLTTLLESAEKAGTWASKFDFVLSFEVIEHVFSPHKFLRSMFELLKPGGYCLVTGIGYEGFDLMTLREESSSVFPPHHLNYLSLKGFESAFVGAGFEKPRIWTPGELDVDLVLQSNRCPEFLKVLSARSPDAVRRFQALLQDLRLSSHVWALAQRPPIEKC